MLSNALRRGLLIFTAISTLAAAPSTAASTAKHTTPTTTETRQLMDTLFSDFALDNFGQNFADALDDDLVWTVTGSSPIAGTYPSKKIYLDKVLHPLRTVLTEMPVPIIDHIFADADWAVVNWHSEGVRGVNGVDYDMSYVWLMRLSGEGKIVEVIGFYDGEKVRAVFEGYDFES